MVGGELRKTKLDLFRRKRKKGYSGQIKLYEQKLVDRKKLVTLFEDDPRERYEGVGGEWERQGQ